MQINKAKTGIKLLIFFYGFIIFQHLSMRAHFRMNALLEAVFIGTLVYLIYGFIRRERVSRWTGMLFHALFQVMETVALVLCLRPGVLAELIKTVPAGTLPGTGGLRLAFFVVFALITCINISAIVFLWKNDGYFSGAGKHKEMEEIV